MVKVNKSVGGPKGMLKRLSGDEAAGTLQQHFQYLKGLGWQAKSKPCFAQFLGVKVNFKRAETNYLACADLVWHRWVASSGKSLTPTRVCATPATVVIRFSNIPTI